MTIGRRLYATIGAAALVVATLAGGGLYAIRSSLYWLDSIYQDALLPALDLKTVSDMYAINLIGTAMKVRLGRLTWEQGIREAENARIRADAAWSTYVSRIKSSEERTLAHEAQQALETARAGSDRLKEILVAGNVAALAGFIGRDLFLTIDPLATAIDELAQSQAEYADQVFQDTLAREGFYQDAMFGLVGVAVVTLLFAFHTTRISVIRSLTEITRATTAVAAGELERGIPSEHRRDEIGALAKALIRFRSNAVALKASEERLKAQAAALELTQFAMDNAPVGILMVDRDGRITYANQAAGGIFGSPAADLVGTELAAFDQDVGDGGWSVVWQELAGNPVGRAGQRLVCRRRQDGSQVPIDEFQRHISFGGKELVCSFVTDITLRKQAEEAVQRAMEQAEAARHQAELSAQWLELSNRELEDARAKAEEATKAKSVFLAMMSHEIRTPMNGIMAMSEMLDNTDLTDDQRDMSAVIRQSSSALLTIINDILDFSKIEAGKLDIEREPFLLSDVVEGAGELISARAEEKGLDFVVDLDPRIADRLIGDQTRVRQILLNLMGNAIKFTASGSVSLLVTEKLPAADGRAETLLRFEVVDSGIGLSEAQRAKLFQAFVQADSSTARKYGGTGLGLSICQRLCQMMGGSIGVDSVEGEGSTFWFELPFGVAAPAPTKPEVAIADARIIAAGFPPGHQQVLAKLLAAAGITDITWTEATPALLEDLRAMVASGEPLPIVMVCAVGGDQAALDLGCWILTSGDLGDCRVVLITARGMASTIAAGDRAGLFATMTLPIRRARLWRTLAAALGRGRLDDRPVGADDDERMVWEPPPRDEARAAGALILVAEDNATNQIVIKRLLDRRGYAHEMSGNGLEALSLYEQGGYGLLLTDFHMPEMDGFQLTETIRAIEGDGRSRLPIVALTADALPGTEQRCLAAGMDGYLTKPIDSRALTATLQKFLPEAAALRRRPERKSASKPSPALAAALTIDPAIFDIERLKESFGDLGSEARTFLSGFLDGVPTLLDAVGEALDRDDGPEARHAAHALKGAAGSVGAVRLHQLSADVQDCLDAGDLDTARLLNGLLRPTYEELVATTAALR
ncbi:MAG: response regulator [Azospirillum sp.]|nr:response regulator [Azospirillum sp.]